MADRREGLRPVKPKVGKIAPKSNAQKCREYKERIKEDPAAYALWKERKNEENKKWRMSLDEQQRAIQREKTRIRVQKCRERRKEKEAGEKSTPKPVETQKLPLTRERAQKDAEKREYNRLRQQNRRAKMSTQKKRRINEKRREIYAQRRKTPAAPTCSAEHPKARRRLTAILKEVSSAIGRSRTKFALFKKNFVHKLLARKDILSCKAPNSYYKRRKTNTNSLLVERFFENAGIDYPGKSGSSVPKKVLTKTMADLLSDFKTLHPGVKISLTTFKRRRPRNIVLSSSRKFLQCLCEKCTNIMLLFESINSYLKSRSCGGQQPLNAKVSCAEDAVSRTLCENANKMCRVRECARCGVGKFLDEIRGEIGCHLGETKKWSRWEKTEKSAKDLVTRESKLEEIVSMIVEALVPLAIHLKTAEWQRHQYQRLRDNLPRGHALCTLDFAENYLCKFQNEVQSAHWSYRQVSVHPCVLFYRCNNADCFKTITDYVVFLSDDLNHDKHMTKHITTWCIQYLKERGIVSVHIFSDGCSSQYKSRFTFNHMTELKKENNVTLTRHFFGANHGKSLCDSCGGTVKNAATRAVASGSHVIQSARNLFDFCEEKMTSVSECTTSHATFSRSFVLINKNDFKRIDDVQLKPVKDIRKMHCIEPVRRGVIKSKDLSCFCDICLLGESGTCANAAFTEAWKFTKIVFSGKKQKGSNQICSSTEDESADIELVETGLSRSEFFVRLQDKFTSCESFATLKDVVRSQQELVDKYALPDLEPFSVYSVGEVDTLALELVRDLTPSSGLLLYPIKTVGDGNCVPRALSLLCFGDQDHHTEIRCRIVMELVSNSLDYLCLDDPELEFLVQHSECMALNAEETFQNEVLKVCHRSSYMGIWQIMAAANVSQAQILSVYPSRGASLVRRFYDRTFVPRELKSTHTLCLLWCATEMHQRNMPSDYWTANHVVPLMGKDKIYVEFEIA